MRCITFIWGIVAYLAEREAAKIQQDEAVEWWTKRKRVMPADPKRTSLCKTAKNGRIWLWICLRLAQYLIRGSCIFTVLAQFAHFSKLRKKRKHCANAISLQKNTPKAKLQLLTDLLDELCQFSDIFQFFCHFPKCIYSLKKNPKIENFSKSLQDRPWRSRGSCAWGLRNIL